MRSNIFDAALHRINLPRDRRYDARVGFSYFAAADHIFSHRDELTGPVCVTFDPERLGDGIYQHILAGTTKLCDCGRYMIVPTRGSYWLTENSRRIILGNGPDQRPELILGPHGGDLSTVYFTLRVSEGKDAQLFGTMQPYAAVSYPPLVWPEFMIKGGESRFMRRHLSILHGEVERNGGALAKHYVGDVTVPVCFIEHVDLETNTVTVIVDKMVRIFEDATADNRPHVCAG